jgi:hypothetical protein
VKKREINIKLWSRNEMEEAHFENLGVDERIISKLILINI